MMNNGSAISDMLDVMARDAGLGVEIAQIRAKAALTEIRAEVPAISWSYVAPRVIRNLTAAVVAVKSGSQINEALTGVPAAHARRFAMGWEALATLEEGVNRPTALLNAAALFDMAGYQANSICLTRLAHRSMELDESVTATRLALEFIQRRLLQVIWLADKANPFSEFEGTESQEQGLAATSEALGIEGLSSASRFFLSGNDRHLEEALIRIGGSINGFTLAGLAGQANLMQTVLSLLHAMQSRSTWKLLHPLSGTARWSRYIRLLGRGLGSNLLDGTSIVELWRSQIDALEAGLLSDDQSKIVRMPTSAGKTRVAELAMAHSLSEHEGSKCIYIAPYRALVEELRRNFLSVFEDLGFQVSSVLGTFESDEMEQLLTNDADVLVVTPEKLDLLHRLRPDFLERVRLVVLDEGQILDDRSRGVKYELLLARLKLRLSNARFVFLSAVIPDQTLEDLAAWLEAGPQGIIKSDWRPSIQRYALLRWNGTRGTLHYSQSDDEPVQSEFVPGIIRQREIRFENPDTGRMLLRRFPDKSSKGQVAAELALTFSKFGSVLVFCSTPRSAIGVAKALLNRIEWTKRSGHPEEIPPFLDAPITRSAQLANEWLGPEHDTTKLLTQGIAVHYGNLPDAIRNAVEEDFRNRRFRVIVATNTLAQGVNLPIRTVIIHSCWRGNSAETMERIPARDYWNIAGRAGRATDETEGTLIHIATTQRDEEDFEHYLSRRDNLEPIESALISLFQDLVDQRISETALQERLDPEILAVLAEESGNQTFEVYVDQLLEASLMRHQIARHQISYESIRDQFQSVAANIVTAIPDAQTRSLFSSTGLRSTTCRHLVEHIGQNEGRLRELLTQSADDSVFELSSFLLEATSGTHEGLIDETFAGSYHELLHGWIRGDAIGFLRESFGGGAPSVEDLARFIQDYFGLRLPWLASAYLRIAASTLSIEPSGLPAQVGFLPSMIKFGLPFAESTWAMSAGVPLRSAAIGIGAAFRQLGNQQSHRGFLEWIGTLTTEDLHHRFGLTGFNLEAVSSSFGRSGRNPFLGNIEGLNDRHVHEVYVQGIQYENRRVAAVLVSEGLSLSAMRDYENLLDRNAIILHMNGNELGYVPKQVAQLLAPEMDAGRLLSVEVVSVEPAEIARILVKLEMQNSDSTAIIS